MVEEISKRNGILEILKVETLTTKEIVEKLKIPIEHVWTYLSQFMKDGKVVKVGKQGKYNLYKAIEDNPVKLLRQLHIIMNKRMDFVEKPSENEIEIIKVIEGMI